MKTSTLLARIVALFLALVPAMSSAQASGTWTATGSMSVGRYAITAVLLNNGKVLVAGGISGTTVLASAELYDPSTGVWTLTGSMKIARNNYVAVPLANGKVLVVGGCTNSNCSAATNTAELYDPVTGVWTPTGSMSTLRYFFAGTGLKNGAVLVEGGCNQVNCGTNTATAELYNPATGKWVKTASMIAARDYHTATLMSDGRVLVVGGYYAGGITEIYNPSTRTWSTAGSALYPHSLHTASLLTNGKVLAEGGLVGNLPSNLCEVFDPVAGTWSATGSMTTKRDNQAALMLPNGRAMVAGGGSYTRPKYCKLASVELYDSAAGTWSSTGSMTIERYQQGMVLLRNGQVLAVGGLSNTDVSLASAELYTP
jgi:N-acetylneuraminic acid mutarotase